MKKIFFLLSIVFVLIACEKEPGEGGTSTITGTVIVQEYNKDMTIEVGEPYAAQDVEVYLIYGDDEIYSDKFQTGYDGKYIFEYLQDGKYTVYVLSKSLENTETNELVPVFKDVVISDKNQIVVVSDLEIKDN